MIFDEFRRFARISTILRMVLIAARKRIAIKCVHFRGFLMDSSNFRVKIHKISALGVWFRTTLASITRAKQHLERRKWTRFQAYSHASNRYVFLPLQYREPKFIVLISWRICMHFNQICMLFNPRRKAWFRCMNGHWKDSKFVIFIVSSSVFCVGKIDLTVTFRELSVFCQ